VPGGPTKRSIEPLVDDERGLERGEVAEDLLKGWVHHWKVKPVVSASIGGTVSVFLAGSSATAVIAAASRASLSALSSFRNVFSESFLDFFQDRSDRHQVAFGLL